MALVKNCFMIILLNPNPLKRGYNLSIALLKLALLFKEGWEVILIEKQHY